VTKGLRALLSGVHRRPAVTVRVRRNAARIPPLTARDRACPPGLLPRLLPADKAHRGTRPCPIFPRRPLTYFRRGPLCSPRRTFDLDLDAPDLRLAGSLEVHHRSPSCGVALFKPLELCPHLLDLFTKFPIALLLFV
jgi:hypothetical protein